jgi:PST family polysaccharide transporter
MRATGASAAYRERVLTALKWSVSGELVAGGIRFAFTIAVARLLSPRDFGFMAMLTVLTQFVGVNADLGFEDALIQRRDPTEAHRSSVFWLMVLWGLALTAGLALAAPWIAAFYGVEEIAPLAVCLAPFFFLLALDTVPRAIIAQRLDFRTNTALRCIAVIGAGTCAVTAAWYGWGAHSLVVDALVGAAIETVLLFAVSGWRPRLRFSRAALADLLGFSAYRPAARILNYWAQQLDKLLIGKLLGSAALGLYARAYDMARFPVLYVSRAIIGVMFPSLALIQDDPARTRTVYLRAMAAVALTSFPMCLGLFAAAEPFLVGVLGPQWRDAAPILRLVSLASLVQTVTSLAMSLCLSQGRADLQFRLTALQRLATIALVVAALPWGVLGVATAQVLAALLTAVPTLWAAGRLVDLGVRAVLASVGRVLLAGVLMAAAVLAIDAGAPASLAPLARFLLQVAAGVLVYWLALWWLRVEAYADVLVALRRPVPPPDGF